MKPTSQPSFTSRPIHQSLLYFCTREWTQKTPQSLQTDGAQQPHTLPPSAPCPANPHPQVPATPSLLLCSPPPLQTLTSLMCKKSLGSKQMAMPCTGTSSLADGL